METDRVTEVDASGRKNRTQRNLWRKIKIEKKSQVIDKRVLTTRRQKNVEFGSPRISLFDFQSPRRLLGGVAQLGEHLPCKQGVKSSNLFISTRGKSEEQELETGS